ncbi:MAG: hypothetical protein ACK4NC_04765 [Candidatus Gracilibacteria bacterium]
MERLKNNSESIKKEFLLEFEEFFAQCDIVVSAPILFAWAGGFSVHFGGISLIQKLPLRTYVGVRKNGLNEIRYKSFKTYSQHRGKIIETPIDAFLDPEGLKRLTNFLKENYSDNFNNEGLDIYILSENEWLDVCPIYTSLGLCILLAFSIIDKSFFDLISNKYDSYKNETLFNLVFRLLWKIFLLLEYSTSLPACGGEVFNCLVSSNFPVMYMTEKRIGINEYDTYTKFPHYLNKEQYNLIDKIQYWGNTFDTALNEKAKWLIRFGIVYPGFKKQVHYEEYGFSVQKKVKYINEFIIDNASLFENNKFFSSVDKPNEILESKLSIINFYSTNIIKRFVENFDANNIKELIIALKQLRDMFNVIYDDDLSYKFSKFEKTFNKFFEDLSSEDNIYFLQEKGITGDAKLLYAISKSSFPYFYEDFINADFHKHHNVSLDYDSLLDGIGTEGAKLEMYREKKHYSDWLKNYSNHTWISNYHEKKLVEDKAELEKVKVLINTVTEKIILNGNKLNSNDLPSQVYAIQVLTLLMKAPAHQIESKELPLSAYSVSKSDFMTKIIRPLEKAFDKYLDPDHKITFECEGNLTEFRIKLHSPVDAIWFLNEVDYK